VTARLDGNIEEYAGGASVTVQGHLTETIQEIFFLNPGMGVRIVGVDWCLKLI
jgi:hypothetical protein